MFFFGSRASGAVRTVVGVSGDVFAWVEEFLFVPVCIWLVWLIVRVWRHLLGLRMSSIGLLMSSICLTPTRGASGVVPDSICIQYDVFDPSYLSLSVCRHVAWFLKGLVERFTYKLMVAYSCPWLADLISFYEYQSTGWMEVNENLSAKKEARIAGDVSFFI